MAIAKNTQTCLESFIVFTQIFCTVAYAKYGHNFQKMQQAGLGRIVENISSGKKNGLSVGCIKDSQCIHQSILMVGGKDNGKMSWDFVRINNLNFSVILAKTKGYPGFEYPVEPVKMMNAMPVGSVGHKIIGLQGESLLQLIHPSGI